MTQALTDWDRRVGRELKLRELYILSAVIEHGGMARAAERLAMSQSAVSEAISNLEGTLRVRLVDRTSKGVRPTIYASALLDHGHVAFNELGRALKDIELLSDPNSGEVRVGAPESLSAGFLARVVDQLSQEHPKIQIHIIQANTASLEFRELRNRNLDLMIGRLAPDFRDEELDASILFQDSNFIVTGASSPLAKRRKIGLAELVTEPWIIPGSSNVMSTLVEDLFRKRGLTLPIKRVTSNSIHLRMHLLATGRFMSLLPNSILHFNADRWSLKALPVDLEIEPRPVAFVTLKNRTLNPTAQRFINCARELAKSLVVRTPARKR